MLGLRKHHRDPSFQHTNLVEDTGVSDINRRWLTCPSQPSTTALIIAEALICDGKGKGTGDHADDDGEGDSVLPMHSGTVFFRAVVLHGFGVGYVFREIRFRNGRWWWRRKTRPRH